MPERLFTDVGLVTCMLAGKENVSKVLFTAIYKDNATGFPYIKRSRIEAYILNTDYLFVPDGNEVLLISDKPNFSFSVQFEPKPKVKLTEKIFKAADYAEKGLRANGVKLVSRTAVSAAISAEKNAHAKEQTKKTAAKPTSKKAASTDKKNETK